MEQDELTIRKAQEWAAQLNKVAAELDRAVEQAGRLVPSGQYAQLRTSTNDLKKLAGRAHEIAAGLLLLTPMERI